MDRTHRTASLISAGLIIIVLLIGVSMYMSSQSGETERRAETVPVGEYSLPGELSDEEKLQRVRNGVYEPEIVVFATTGYANAIASGQFFAHGEDGLVFATYLVEGYASDPSKIECRRGRPPMDQIQGLLDGFGRSGGLLTEDQDALRLRIQKASGQIRGRDGIGNAARCEPQGDDVSQVSK